LPTGSQLYADDLDLDGDVDMTLVTTYLGSAKLGVLQSYFFSDIQVTGTLFIDHNANGIMDGEDYGFPDFGIHATPESDFCFTSNTGNYLMNFSDSLGTYVLAPQIPDHWIITSDSLSYTIVIDSLFASLDSLSFGFAPDTIFDSLRVNLIGGFPRCNDEVNYWFNLANKGTTVPSGILQLTLDNTITYLSSSVTPDSISGQNIYWNFDSLAYFNSELFQVLVEMPDFTSMGDTLTSYIMAYVDSLGTNISFSDSLQQVVVCAYDPNDKTALPAGVDSLGYIPVITEYLDYTIRFQNTGNDTALTVVIKDQLDVSLDWSSLTPLAKSHDVDITVNQFGELTLSFHDIMLPDSNVNELASHGFFKYRININPGIDAGTSIYNTAFIYFDFNPPVITNTKIHTLYDCSTILEGVTVNSITCENEFIIGIAPNVPSNVNLLWMAGEDSLYGNFITWQADTSGVFDLILKATTDFCYSDSIFTFNIISEINGPTTFQNICEGDSAFIFGEYEYLSAIYYDTLTAFTGCDSIVAMHLNIYPNEVEITNLDDTLCQNAAEVEITTTPPGGTLTGVGLSGNMFDPIVAGSGGHYLNYVYIDGNGCQFEDSTFIVVEDCLGLQDYELRNVSVKPNPFSESTQIMFEKPLTGDHHVIIYQLDGTIVYTSNPVVGNFINIDRNNMSPGTYVLSVLDVQGITAYRCTLIVF